METTWVGSNLTFNNTAQILKILLQETEIKTIYDIGANKGDWTRTYSHYCKNLVAFYMFEANPIMIKPEDLNYEWHNVLLSSEDNIEVTFYSISGPGDSYYRERSRQYSKEGPQLKLITRKLGSYIKEKGIPNPDIIKIDTQGSELDIIKGAKNIFEKSKLIILEVPIISYNEGAPKTSNYIDEMTSMDFIPVGIDQIQYIDNTVIFMDMIFMKSSTKYMTLGNSKFLESDINRTNF